MEDYKEFTKEEKKKVMILFKKALIDDDEEQFFKLLRYVMCDFYLLALPAQEQKAP